MRSEIRFLSRLGLTGLSLALTLSTTDAKGDIDQPSPGLTVVSFQLHVKGSAANAYTAVTHPETWWNGEHSYSGSASNMSLDPVAGGCWCENLAARGSVQHMRVLAAIPGSLPPLTGRLGAVQAEA